MAKREKKNSDSLARALQFPLTQILNSGMEQRFAWLKPCEVENGSCHRVSGVVDRVCGCYGRCEWEKEVTPITPLDGGGPLRRWSPV
jgi:hypothetical protein